MSTAKHTPLRDSQDYCAELTAERDRLLAENAELRAALEQVLPILEYRHRHGDDDNDDCDAYGIAVAALAQAKGPA